MTNVVVFFVTLLISTFGFDARTFEPSKSLLKQIEEGREELPVLIQVNFGGEKSKTGTDPGGLPQLLEAVAGCQRVRLIGLMTLPPYFENPDCGRPFFQDP